MLRRALAVPLLLVVASCGPPLKPLPPMAPLAPLPAPPSESPSPVLPRGSAERAAPRPPEHDERLAALYERGLLVPVQGVAASQIPDTFKDARDGVRVHNAEDILAKRGTPVLAADDGTVIHVGKNALGGNVVWTTDPSHKFAFYYAHLQGYAKGLHDGQTITRGEVLGYVGTSGNAPKNVPHLHFQLLRIVKGVRYSEGPPVDPLPFFAPAGTTR
ncbi:MAG: M23 family metallopeptidase [Gemmatimonadaceae bacterium]